MALQNVIVEVAFTATPFADPATLTWSDISVYVESWTVSRGRADEQSQMQAGTAQVSLQNTDGRFDPDNASSPYSPNVLPGVPLRVSTTFLGTTYRLFYGFVEAWEQHYDNMTPIVVVSASDGLKAILSYSVGRGYTETLVGDYGGTPGAQFDKVWPFQAPNNVNSYLNTASANVTHAGSSHPTGIAETGLQLSGSASYFFWNDAAIGDLAYWLGVDGWFRVDTAPGAASVPKCLFMNGNSNNADVTPGLGFGAMTAAFGDSMSAYAVNLGSNILGAATADPTSTTGWSVTGSGASIATAAITTSNGLQRIYLDNGATDFYGATKAMRLTMAAGSAAIDMLSPFTNATAGTAYTFQSVLTLEETRTNPVTVKIDWYTGATFISSTTVMSGLTGASVQRISAKATAPAGTTKFQWHVSTTSQTGGTFHVDVAQLIAVAGSLDALPWYAGGTAPGNRIVFNIAAYGNTNPPGQSVSANGWPCYADLAMPAVGSWFHLAIDSGTDNAATPYASTSASRGLPSLWVNGVAQRLWTTGAPGSGITFNVQPWSGLGARLYFNGSGTPVVDTATSLAASFDELYVADGSTASAAEVTAAKAAAHYGYGLTRHDFVQQLTGARIGAVLDSLSWPAAQRSIDAGTVDVLAHAPDTGTGASGTQLIQDATIAEGGLYFIGGDGVFHFWDQAHAMGGSPVMTVGDGATDVHYLGWPVVVKDDMHIFNLIQLTQNVTDGSGAPSAVVQVADATSQARYNVRSLGISAPWVNQADMAALAASMLADYKNPATRVSSISVEGVTSNQFAALLARELGDYVQAHLVPANYTGPAVVVDAYLQGLTITGASDRSWVFALSLTQTIAGH